MYGHDSIAPAIVIDIDADKDAGSIKVEFLLQLLWICSAQRERPELSRRSANLPLARSPIDDSGRILAQQARSRGKMRVIEGNEGRRNLNARSLDVYIPGACVTDAE